jgi:tRNA threonylcarbamoyladenosine biosynthesis protein TsaB
VRILALDTATESCSAALLIDGVMRTREKRLERGHAGQILVLVDELLREAGVALGTLGALAFGRGPGAFTGLRLAASVAQGLAFGAGLPVVPISDLRALAQRALEADAGVGRVLVCTDARMREVYWGCFSRTATGLAVAAGDERVGPPRGVQLPDAWRREAEGAAAGGPGRSAGLCGAGSGFAVYPELRDLVAPGTPILDSLLPRAEEVARLAAAELRENRVLPPEEALPVYLRDNVTHGRPPGH